MRDSKVHENRREEPPDFSMTNLRQAGFPTEMSVKKAVASDAEIIHLRLVGSEIGQQTDREGKQSATPASIDQLQPGRLERRPGAQHTALKVLGSRSKISHATSRNSRISRISYVQSLSIRFAFFSRNTIASATASKMLIRVSSLFHGLRFGGNLEPSCSGNRLAMISASACLVPGPSGIKVFITCLREYNFTLTLRITASLMICWQSFRIRDARREPLAEVFSKISTPGW